MSRRDNKSLSHEDLMDNCLGSTLTGGSMRLNLQPYPQAAPVRPRRGDWWPPTEDHQPKIHHHHCQNGNPAMSHKLHPFHNVNYALQSPAAFQRAYLGTRSQSRSQRKHFHLLNQEKRISTSLLQDQAVLQTLLHQVEQLHQV